MLDYKLESKLESKLEANGEGQMNNTDCNGTHRFFVANDAVYKGKIYIFLVCTTCGEGRKVEFEVAEATSEVQLNKKET